MENLQVLKARSLQCGFWLRSSQILMWILPWILGWVFSSLFLSKKEGPKNPPPPKKKISPAQNSPRVLFGKIPVGFLQKPSLDKFPLPSNPCFFFYLKNRGQKGLDDRVTGVPDNGNEWRNQSDLSGDTFSIDAPPNLLRTKGIF